MGHFVDGVWKEDSYDPKKEGGQFVRVPSRFRNWVTPDGAPGPEGDGGFKAEPGRYHLYIAHGCPWAHRTLIFRKLKKLENAISLSIVAPAMEERGWWFGDVPGSIPDNVNGKKFLGEVYLLADAHYTGRVTVPVLWDKQRKTIVNNESSEIIRMFNSAFDEFTNEREDFYPAELRTEIDKVNQLVYANVNNGVYRAGFALTQAAYEEAFKKLFAALDELEARLSKSRYLVGNRITEADWRLFVTQLRFDAVYYVLFKCNLRRIADYPNLSNYLRDLYQVPGVAETVNMDHIKRSYYRARPTTNPLGIVPVGPAQDFSRPHDRARFGN
ncbi:MAG TPA: glutathione S-transferase family protein [Xanthobacteraceae bacterium]|jgi:putative glutathione S-transferase